MVYWHRDTEESGQFCLEMVRQLKRFYSPLKIFRGVATWLFSNSSADGDVAVGAPRVSSALHVEILQTKVAKAEWGDWFHFQKVMSRAQY